MIRNAIWITWENQRRSIELARALGVDCHVLTDNDALPRIFRYSYLSQYTLWVLLRNRPNIVFAQNPSIMLAFFLCLLKNIFQFKLVIDRHSNFKFHTLSSSKNVWKLFHYLSRFTIRHAHLTIVTNQYLFDIVNSWGGRAFLLQDKLPSLKEGSKIPLDGKINIAYICSYSDDEPVEEVIDSAQRLSDDWVIYITGKINKERIDKYTSIKGKPKNVKLTGYLNEREYQSLLVSTDMILVLTKQDHTLTCGAYEGVSLSKPLVVSNTEALKSYFCHGAIYTDRLFLPESIADSIKECANKQKKLEKEIIQLKISINKTWPKKLNDLIDVAENL